MNYKEIEVFNKSLLNKIIKIDIIKHHKDIEDEVIDTLEGNCLSGSIRIDSTSEMRRSCNLSFAVTKSSMGFGIDKDVFINRWINLQIGIYTNTQSEIIWYNMGYFVLDEPSFEYNAKDHTLSFTGIDLVSLLNGERNGVFPGVSATITADSNVRDVIIDTMNTFTEFNINSSYISECLREDGEIQNVPNDMDFSQGTNAWQILSGLRDILPVYEMYFDKNGDFIYKKIPITKPEAEEELEETVKNTIRNNIISESTKDDLRSIKNLIEVYGTQLEATIYCSEVSIKLINIPVSSNPPYQTETINEIELKITEPKEGLPTEGNIVSFVLKGSLKPERRIKININGISQYLANSDGSFVYGKDLELGNYYTILIGNEDPNNPMFPYNLYTLLGGLQPYAIVSDNRDESPYNVNNGVVIRNVFSGGEFDNISSNYLARERALWELYKSTNMIETVTINTNPLYFIDVEDIVKYAVQGTDNYEYYIVQSINFTLSDDSYMSITLQKFYDYYSNAYSRAIDLRGNFATYDGQYGIADSENQFENYELSDYWKNIDDMASEYSNNRPDLFVSGTYKTFDLVNIDNVSNKRDILIGLVPPIPDVSLMEEVSVLVYLNGTDEDNLVCSIPILENITSYLFIHLSVKNGRIWLDTNITDNNQNNIGYGSIVSSIIPTPEMILEDKYYIDSINIKVTSGGVKQINNPIKCWVY